MYYTFNELKIGISIPGLLATNMELSESADNIVDRHLYSMISYTKKLSDDWTAYPSILVKTTSNHNQIDANINFKLKNKLWFGTSYRQDFGPTIYVGIDFGKLLSVYSLDISTNEVADYSNGSHELTFGYDFIPDSELETRNRKEENLEEERRLFYVAITRAERRLFLSFASSRFKWGQYTDCEPSRFISELDESFLEKHEITPKNKNDFGPHKIYAKTKFKKKEYSAATKKFIPPKNLTNINRTKDVSINESDLSKIQTGMKVKHARFGDGKVLTISGDVTSEEVMPLVEKYFASINRGTKPVRRQKASTPRLSSDRYTGYTDNVYLPLTDIVFPTVPNHHKDEPALDMLAALMGDGNNSIFYKNFVKDKIYN